MSRETMRTYLDQINPTGLPTDAYVKVHADDLSILLTAGIVVAGMSEEKIDGFNDTDRAFLKEAISNVINSDPLFPINEDRPNEER
jgi:hypothetical protein